MKHWTTAESIERQRTTAFFSVPFLPRIPLNTDTNVTNTQGHNSPCWLQGGRFWGTASTTIHTIQMWHKETWGGSLVCISAGWKIPITPSSQRWWELEYCCMLSFETALCYKPVALWMICSVGAEPRMFSVTLYLTEKYILDYNSHWMEPSSRLIASLSNMKLVLTEKSGNKVCR